MAKWHDYAGAEWMESAAGYTLSPVGREAADIMGFVLRGIYHLSRRDREASVFSDTLYAEVRLSRTLATFDGQHLTELVLLAHARAVRIDIDAKARGYLRLLFHQRRRSGQFSERHPSIEHAVADLRRLIPDAEVPDAS